MKSGNNALNSFGWYGKLLWVAGGVANVNMVENMNCYDFARMLSFEIAKNEI